eukprot:TRINITY_DN40216_c0_g1_i1.p1 TRINITY_DN40216_c0_g1~~TRINITY_DN40216_c0_g1_i1.p1  ORF type:complete len:123 (-),score=11.77 TRINITY_DN40216_c0_g1_i1:42-410(-)
MLGRVFDLWSGKNAKIKIAIFGPKQRRRWPEMALHGLHATSKPRLGQLPKVDQTSLEAATLSNTSLWHCTSAARLAKIPEIEKAIRCVSRPKPLIQIWKLLEIDKIDDEKKKGQEISTSSVF